MVDFTDMCDQDKFAVLNLRLNAQREQIATLEGHIKSGINQAEKDQILHRMVEGLHSMVFGTYSIQSGDYALESLGDGGEIHEYVHAMLRLLPPRHLEQIQSGRDTSVHSTPTGDPKIDGAIKTIEDTANTISSDNCDGEKP